MWVVIPTNVVVGLFTLLHNYLVPDLLPWLLYLRVCSSCCCSALYEGSNEKKSPCIIDILDNTTNSTAWFRQKSYMWWTNKNLLRRVKQSTCISFSALGTGILLVLQPHEIPAPQWHYEGLSSRHQWVVTVWLFTVVQDVGDLRSPDGCHEDEGHRKKNVLSTNYKQTIYFTSCLLHVWLIFIFVCPVKCLQCC